MPISPGVQLGLAPRFKVEVQGIDLGGWATCKGLAVQFENDFIGEGANYESWTILPKRVKYGPITLQRAINAADSEALQNWLRSVVTTWFSDSSDGGYRDHTAQITLLDSQHQPVTNWRLRNVYPQNWNGPDLDAASGQVAIETLILVHEGFL